MPAWSVSLEPVRGFVLPYKVSPKPARSYSPCPEIGLGPEVVGGSPPAGVPLIVYYYKIYEKAVSGGGEREKGGPVLRDTTSRGLFVRVRPPHTFLH